MRNRLNASADSTSERKGASSMLDARSNTPILVLTGLGKVISRLPFLKPFFILRQAQDKTPNFCRRVFIFSLTFVFLLNSVGGGLFVGESWAAKLPSGLTSVGPDQAGSPAPLKNLSAGTFTLPQELGYVQEAADVPGSVRTVIHIQDAHCNYAAQKSISEILNYLIGEYGVYAVNCEGGAEGYDLSPFTDIPEKEIREKTSDFFVKEGVVSAAEYFAVNNPEKVKLWGVEDPDLYIKNLKVYRDSIAYKPQADRYLKSIGYILDNLKKHIYPKGLLELDGYYTRYKDNKATFKDYISYLVMAAQKRLINVKAFPNIYFLSQTLAEEDNINFRRANNEKDEVVDKLKKVLSRNELEELMIKVTELKAEKISQGDFYAYLVKKARSIKLDMKNYTELQKYIIYINIYSAIDRTKITKEMDSLEDRIKDSLYENDTQRELGILSKNLILEKNIFNVSLTRDDYIYYKEHRASFAAANFVDFIDKQAPLYKISAVLDKNIATLDVYREKMEVFYECSLGRDKAFIKNIRFTDHTRPNSIIITGGFHTENLRELFKKENVSYISIMPKFTNEKGYESPYLKRLAGQRTALENVIDTAIPAVLNLQVVEILNEKLGRAVEGEANLARIRVAIAVVAALNRMSPLVVKIITKKGYTERVKQDEEKVVTFAKGEGADAGNIVEIPTTSHVINATLIAQKPDNLKFTLNLPQAPAQARPEEPVVQPSAATAAQGQGATGAVPVFKPFARVTAEGKVVPIPAATQAPATAVKEAEPIYKAAKSIVPDIARAMRRGAPTYLLSPALSEGDIAPETSNNRVAEQILGKQGHEIHAKSYLADGKSWKQDLTALKILLERTLGSFANDAKSNRLTRMSIRIITEEESNIRDVKAVVREILKKYVSEAEIDTIVENQIKFIPINIQNVEHINASIDLFTDIGMMEINRYLQGDYPRGELSPELVNRFVVLLKSSITNFDDFKTDDIAVILNMIFNLKIVLHIKPINWKTIDEWKKANDEILKSL